MAKRKSRSELQAERQALTDKIESLQLGFMNRSLAQIGLPHSNLNTNFFERTSGLVTLSITSDPKIGLPYGTYPRLLLAWICTEAVRTQNQILHLGTNQTEFLKKLNISNSGSTIALLREQSNRLLSSLFRLSFADKQYRGFSNLILASEGIELWRPFEGVWETQFKLSTEFFNDVLKKPVPLDLNVLNKIRKSPLTMDVYTWIAYRTYLVYTQGGRPVKISWEDLQAQFGSSFGHNIDSNLLTADEIIKKEMQSLRDFRRRFLLSLNNLSKFYPELNQVINADSQFLIVGGAKLILHK
ncbi:replication protein RepA [Oligella urethralis]|uniref:Plasmid encoded RepA protein n=1 Tax=Oligella urethralis TaxID=90245 RepID=A0A2X1UQ26_9BURK|nr:replication protein RepA [Oligella urethralis]SPY09118.1 Plasmid encoded RepA protein [Oligella urethralis]